jgi:hypothetical protein
MALGHCANQWFNPFAHRQCGLNSAAAWRLIRLSKPKDPLAFHLSHQPIGSNSAKWLIRSAFRAAGGFWKYAQPQRKPLCDESDNRTNRQVLQVCSDALGTVSINKPLRRMALT